MKGFSTARRDNETTACIDGRMAERRRGWSLDQAFYTDPHVFELELELISADSGFAWGTSAEFEIQEIIFSSTFFGESIIVIRGQREDIHAVINVCRHRAHAFVWRGREMRRSSYVHTTRGSITPMGDYYRLSIWTATSMLPNLLYIDAGLTYSKDLFHQLS